MSEASEDPDARIGPGLFVFTAADIAARQHLQDTVLRPIDRQHVVSHLGSDETANLEKLSSDGHLYAWGAVPGPRNVPTWDAMQVGDYVFAYYERRYHLVSHVTAKVHSKGLATALWQTNQEGQTWEYMYFLDRPRSVNAAADQFQDVLLPRSYQGFTKIVTALEPIRSTYGSIEKFIDRRLAAASDVVESTPSTLKSVLESFTQATRTSGLDYGEQHQQLVIRLLASLMTRPFVILTGLSGSGKSQLALKLGQWFGNDRYQAVAVRPDWTGPEAMLGYEDLLQPTTPRPWVVGDVLKLALRAAADPGHPYLLLLDEMNLAHVERYFADFLSGMESEEVVLPNLSLSEHGWSQRDEAAKIRVPANLFVVGTVNVDETTYMFSPKVLDRANTIEFRVMTADLARAAGKPGFGEGADASLLENFVTAALDPSWHRENRPAWSPQYEGAVATLHQTLSAVGWEFGYRTYYDMVRFAALASAMGVEKWEQVLDLQVLQKVLPRLNGSKRRLEPALSRLGRFCQDLTAADTVKDDPTKLFMPIEQDLPSPALPMSYDKIRRMHRLLVQNQFASFAE